MIRIELQIALNYQVDPLGADFVFNIHAARTASQRILVENLFVNQPVESQVYTDPFSGNRYMRLHALPGELNVSYTATIDLTHHFAEPNQIAEVPVRNLPPEAMGYIYPSRYCQSDRLLKLANNNFGHLPQGYGRVVAIRDWVQRHVTFTSNSSTSNTSAVDTLIGQVGICRDFAHLMVALCRAINIPARFTTGTDYGADPVLGPPDFHAYVEAYVGDRWYIFDPSGTAIPMGLVRFGTGRDAADVAFATIFGNVQSHAPVIQARAVADVALGAVLPHHCQQALSTDANNHSARVSVVMA
ncbi:MAG: transglutaminase family protein [Pseudomonadota bacterium]